MAGTGDAVGDQAGEVKIVAIGGEAVRDGGDRLRHGAGIDHRQDRQIEGRREIGGRGLAVEQPHHAFDQDHIGFLRRLEQQGAAFFGPDHPEIELIDRRTGRLGENQRIEKIGAGLEDSDLEAAAAVKPRQAGGDGGLALPRSAAGDQQRGAGRHV